MPRPDGPIAESHAQEAAAAVRSLDPRKAAILEAVVTEYIGTAQPVGSQHVAQAAGINVSSATVRSEMAASSTRATWSSRTPAPAASPPTRATASSSTT